MAESANSHLFTAANARQLGARGAAVRRQRRLLRSQAAADARLAESGSVFALVKKQGGTVARALDAKSSVVRGLMAVEAMKHAESLAKADKPCDSGVFKTLVDAFDKLFGWSKQAGPSSLVIVGMGSDLEQTPQQVVSCGVVEAETVNITERKADLNEVKQLQ